MIAGGDVKEVHKVCCGSLLLQTERQQCERIVAGQFEDICSSTENKPSCEKDVTDVFIALNDACAKEDKGNVLNVAKCFYKEIQVARRNLSNAKIDFCGNGPLEQREDCAKLIEQKYNDACSDAPEKKECEESFFAVLQALYGSFTQQSPNDLLIIDQKFYKDLQNPTQKFDSGKFKQWTLQKYIDSFKRAHAGIEVLPTD